MTSIKIKILKALAKRGTVTRKELILIVFKAQGRKEKDFPSTQGYYGNNLEEWLSNGLIMKPSKGKYKITKMGKLYIKDTKQARLLIRLKKAETRAKNWEHNFNRMREELAKAENKLRHIGWILEADEIN